MDISAGRIVEYLIVAIITIAELCSSKRLTVDKNYIAPAAALKKLKTAHNSCLMVKHLELARVIQSLCNLKNEETQI